MPKKDFKLKHIFNKNMRKFCNSEKYEIRRYGF